MITWKTINILYFKDAVNFGLQMSLVTDWKVKLNKHPNNISDLHLLLTCQAFCWLCVRTSVNSSYLGGASVHWFAAGSVSVYCTGCGFNDTWYTPCGETRSVVVILLRSGGPEKSTYPVPGTKNKKYEYLLCFSSLPYMYTAKKGSKLWSKHKYSWPWFSSPLFIIYIIYDLH